MELKCPLSSSCPLNRASFWTGISIQSPYAFYILYYLLKFSFDMKHLSLFPCCLDPESSYISSALQFSNAFIMWHISSILQLEEGVVDLFSKSIKEDSLDIDMDVVEKPRTINAYVQAWHNQIWEPGFSGIFKGRDSYNKTKAFKDQRQMDLTVKRVVFTYKFISQ
jgi:hypothetical protein